LPDFSPDISLGLGGLTIGSGGTGGVTIGDIIEIVSEGGGGDCPDPCDPVDYERIRDITFEELDSKFPPARPATLQFETYTAANSNSITLPLYSQWVEVEIVQAPDSVRSQWGGDNAPDVQYVGWYSFGVTTVASERVPLNYGFVSVPVPVGARNFSFTIYAFGTAKVKVGYLSAG
jgi:hypothetical protein